MSAIRQLHRHLRPDGLLKHTTLGDIDVLRLRWAAIGNRAAVGAVGLAQNADIADPDAVAIDLRLGSRALQLRRLEGETRRRGTRVGEDRSFAALDLLSAECAYSLRAGRTPRRRQTPFPPARLLRPTPAPPLFFPECRSLPPARMADQPGESFPDRPGRARHKRLHLFRSEPSARAVAHCVRPPRGLRSQIRPPCRWSGEPWWWPTHSRR